MSAPRLHVKCTYPGCTAAFYETGGNHERANREAIKRGWFGDQKTGCLCVDSGTLCPDHARWLGVPEPTASNGPDA